VRWPWSYQRIALWCADLAPLPAGTMPEADCRVVGPQAIQALAAATGLTTAALAARLETSSCYGGWDGGQIVAYGWVSEQPTAIGELDAGVEPPAGESYIWDCATVPTHRRRGWYRRLLGYLLAELAGRGTRRAWIAAYAGNEGARRVLLGSGFRPVLTVHRARVWRVERRWMRAHSGAPAADVDAAARLLVFRQPGPDARLAPRNYPTQGTPDPLTGA
jgi:ribosomal protein S18 acetylase RimI-like enzyme